MSANINPRNSPELSLQPQAIIFPKCQHQRTAADQGPAWQCPNCGIAYNKATAQADDAVAHSVRNDATQNMRVTKLDFFGTWEGRKMSLLVGNFELVRTCR
jgi:hypothetical protein